jgi:hypothetical protein
MPVVGVFVILFLGLSGSLIPPLVNVYAPRFNLNERFGFRFFNGLAAGLVLAVGCILLHSFTFPPTRRRKKEGGCLNLPEYNYLWILIFFTAIIYFDTFGDIHSIPDSIASFGEAFPENNQTAQVPILPPPSPLTTPPLIPPLTTPPLNPTTHHSPHHHSPLPILFIVRLMCHAGLAHHVLLLLRFPSPSLIPCHEHAGSGNYTQYNIRYRL